MGDLGIGADRPERFTPALDQAYAALDGLYSDLDRRLYNLTGDARQERTADMMFHAIELERMFGPVGAAIFLRLEARLADAEQAIADVDARLSQNEIDLGRPQSARRGVRTIAGIVELGCRLARVSPADVRGTSSEAAVVAARVAIAAVAIAELGAPAAAIGRGIGGRSARDVDAMVRRAELRAKGDQGFRALMHEIGEGLDHA